MIRLFRIWRSRRRLKRTWEERRHILKRYVAEDFDNSYLMRLEILSNRAEQLVRQIRDLEGVA